MTTWPRRIRGALLMALTWALVWAPAAVVIGILTDPDDSMDEMWIAIGAYAGFLGGLVFAVVLWMAARHRRFEELSVPRFAAWGAAAGFVVGALPFFLGTPNAAVPLWQLAGPVVGALTILSAGSAAASLTLARSREQRTLRGGESPRSRELLERHD
jgi:H+/Cl- antiporter ClcA